MVARHHCALPIQHNALFDRRADGVIHINAGAGERVKHFRMGGNAGAPTATRLADAPIHLYLEPAYITGTQVEFGIPNIVTAVLGSYRGYDTLGETAVIFAAAVGVMTLLVHVSDKDKDAPSE